MLALALFLDSRNMILTRGPQTPYKIIQAVCVGSSSIYSQVFQNHLDTRMSLLSHLNELVQDQYMRCLRYLQ